MGCRCLEDAVNTFRRTILIRQVHSLKKGACQLVKLLGINSGVMRGQGTEDAIAASDRGPRQIRSGLCPGREAPRGRDTGGWPFSSIYHRNHDFKLTCEMAGPYERYQGSVKTAYQASVRST